MLGLLVLGSNTDKGRVFQELTERIKKKNVNALVIDINTSYLNWASQSNAFYENIEVCIPVPSFLEWLAQGIGFVRDYSLVIINDLNCVYHEINSFGKNAAQNLFAILLLLSVYIQDDSTILVLSTKQEISTPYDLLYDFGIRKKTKNSKILTEMLVQKQEVPKWLL